MIFKILLSFASFILCFVFFASKVVANDNVLVFMMDDLDEQTFNQLLDNSKLPNIKKYLIDKGVRFMNSFVTDSICCSSRATFLTGKYPHNTGVYSVWGWEGGLRGFTGINNNIATWLKSVSYSTGHIGKYMNTYEFGNAVQPGWDYWRNILGYDSRPGMYPVYDNQGNVSWPDLYQAKYMSDLGNQFIDSHSNNFFLVMTPHTPHVSASGWEYETEGVFSPEIENLGIPFAGYTVFGPVSGTNTLRRKVVYKGPDGGGNYSVYQNNFDQSTMQWSGWSVVNPDLTGTGNLPIVAFSVFNVPSSTSEIRRQNLIRGNSTSGFQMYQREIVNNVTGQWILLGDVDQVLSGTGNLPVVGYDATDLNNSTYVEYLLRGDLQNGYELYSRISNENMHLNWEKEPYAWDDESGVGEIVEMSIENLGDGQIELQIVRKETGLNKYVAYLQKRRNYYADLLNILTQKYNPSIYRDEAEMFASQTSIFGNSLLKMSKDSASDSNWYWRRRVYADGNWSNVQENQTFPLSLYGGVYPAGSLRAGGDPDGYSPLDSRFDLPHLNSAHFNSVNCQFKIPLICETWPDAQKTLTGGMNVISLMRRLHLDRLESMISIDVMIGEVMKKLEQKGVIDQTLVIFTSDNGHFMGEFRLGNKIYPYEDSLRVPLIVRPPRSLLTSGKKNNNTVVNIDLAPTILDYTGLSWDSATYNVDGRSLRTLIESPVNLTEDWRKWFLIEYHFPRAQNKIDPDFSVVNNNAGRLFAVGIPDIYALRIGLEAQKFEGRNNLFVNYEKDPLALNNPPFLEYYNMISDPMQINNLFNNSTRTIDQTYGLRKYQAENLIEMFKGCFGDYCRIYDTMKFLKMNNFDMSELIRKSLKSTTAFDIYDFDDSLMINSLDLASFFVFFD